MGRAASFPRNSAISGISRQRSSAVATPASLDLIGFSDRRYRGSQGFEVGKSRPRGKMAS